MRGWVRWVRIAVLALATVCLGAEEVEDADEEMAARPVAESDDGKASPPVADRESVAQPPQREPSASASESTLRRIRTTPLSAAADIPLPQDI